MGRGSTRVDSGLLLCALGALTSLIIMACFCGPEDERTPPDCFPGAVTEADVEGVWVRSDRFLVLGPDRNGIEYSKITDAGNVYYSVQETSWTLTATDECIRGINLTQFAEVGGPRAETFNLVGPGGTAIESYSFDNTVNAYNKVSLQEALAFRNSLPMAFRAMWPGRSGGSLPRRRLAGT